MDLLIADFKISIQSEYPIFMEEGYNSFMLEANNKAADITINCFAGLPMERIQNKEFVFEAKNETQRFYSIIRLEDSLGIIIYDQQTESDIQQIAILDKTFKHWQIYSELQPNGLLFPLKYPMGPIIMYYLTVQTEAVMMHASGIFDGTKGRLFTGFSGAGKSTMSELWSSSGSQIINDDRIIIRKRGEDYIFYNTPMYYPDDSKSAPLHAIHLIRHFPENKSKKCSGALAVSKVLAFCIQNNYDPKYIQNHLNFVLGLCSRVDVYETGFVPNTSVVDYIVAHEA